MVLISLAINDNYRPFFANKPKIYSIGPTMIFKTSAYDLDTVTDIVKFYKVKKSIPK